MICIDRARHLIAWSARASPRIKVLVLGTHTDLTRVASNFGIAPSNYRAPHVYIAVSSSIALATMT